MNSKVIAVLVVLIVAVAAVGVFFMTGTPEKNEIVTGDSRLMVYGNADLDDDLDEQDIQMLKNIIAGDAEPNRYADANRDGTVDSKDIELVQKFIRGESATMFYDDTADGVGSVQFPVRSIMGIHQHVLIPLMAMGALPYMHGYVLHESGMEGAEMLSPLYKSQDNCCVSYNTIDLEKFSNLKVKPEYVITYNNSLSAEPTLETAGIHFIHLDFTNIYTMSKALLTIGCMMGLSENAKEYVNYVDEMIDSVAKTLSDNHTVRKSVMCTYMTNCVDNRNGFHSAAAEAAGATIVTDWTDTYRSFDKGAEWLYEYTPDYLFYFGSWGYTSDFDQKETYVKNADYFTDLSAYKSGKFYVVNSSMPVPIISAYIAQILYPEVFGEHYGDDFNNNFLKKFFPDYFREMSYNAYDHDYYISAMSAGVDIGALKSLSFDLKDGETLTADTLSAQLSGKVLNGLTLNVPGDEAKAQIDAAAIRIVAENQSFLKVRSDKVTVLFSSGVMTTLNNGKKATVSVGVTTDASAIEAKLGPNSGAYAMVVADLLSGGSAVHGLKGSATVTVPLDIGSNDPEKVNVWYRYDNGTYAQYDAVYEDGSVRFTVDHFSEYYIAFCEPGQEPPAPVVDVNDNAMDIALYLLGHYDGAYATCKDAPLTLAEGSTPSDAKVSVPNGSSRGNTENYLRFVITDGAKTLFDEAKATHLSKIGTSVMGATYSEIKVMTSFDGFSGYYLNSAMTTFFYVAGYIADLYFEGYFITAEEITNEDVQVLVDAVYEAAVSDVAYDAKVIAENLLAGYRGPFAAFNDNVLQLFEGSDATFAKIFLENGSSRGTTENYVSFTVGGATELFAAAKEAHGKLIGTNVMGADYTEIKVAHGFGSFSGYYLNSVYTSFFAFAGCMGDLYFEGYFKTADPVYNEDVQALTDAIYNAVLGKKTVDAMEIVDNLSGYNGMYSEYNGNTLAIADGSTSKDAKLFLENGSSRGTTENYVRFVVTDDAAKLFDEAKATHLTKIGTSVMGATYTEIKVMTSFEGFSGYYLNSAYTTFFAFAGYLEGLYVEGYFLTSSEVYNEDVQEFVDIVLKAVAGEKILPKADAKELAENLLGYNGIFSTYNGNVLELFDGSDAESAKIFLENGSSRGTTENYVSFTVGGAAELFATAKEAHGKLIGTNVMGADYTEIRVMNSFDGFSGYYLNSMYATFFAFAGYLGDVYFEGYFKTAENVYNEDVQVLTDCIRDVLDGKTIDMPLPPVEDEGLVVVAKDLLDAYDGVFKTYKGNTLELSDGSVAEDAKVALDNGSTRGNTENFVRFVMSDNPASAFAETADVYAAKIGTSVMGATYTGFEFMTGFEGFSGYYLNSSMARLFYIAGYVSNVYFEGYFATAEDIAESDVSELVNAIYKAITGEEYIPVVEDEGAVVMAKDFLDSYDGVFVTYKGNTLAFATDSTSEVAKVFLENGSSRGNTENFVRFTVSDDAEKLFGETAEAYAAKIGTSVMGATYTGFEFDTGFDGFSGYYLNSAMSRLFYMAGYIGNVYFDGYFTAASDILSEDVEVLVNAVYKAITGEEYVPVVEDEGAVVIAKDFLDDYDGVFLTYKDNTLAFYDGSTAYVAKVFLENGSSRNPENYIEFTVDAGSADMFSEISETYSAKIGGTAMGGTYTAFEFDTGFDGFSGYYLNASMAKLFYIAGYVGEVFFKGYFSTVSEVLPEDVQTLVNSIYKAITGEEYVPEAGNEGALAMADALLDIYDGVFISYKDNVLAVSEDSDASVAKVVLANGSSRNPENFVRFTVSDDAAKLFAETADTYAAKIGNTAMGATYTGFDIETGLDGFSGYYLNASMAKLFYMAGYVGNVYFDGYFAAASDILSEDVEVLVNAIVTAVAA
ncbi:MAG: hypothetical protein MJZ68_04175 [archaeon]|nr:hypothetical protein [archaeon]